MTDKKFDGDIAAYLDSLTDEIKPVTRELLDTLAWSGSAYMSLSLLAAVLDKEETLLTPALDTGAADGLFQKTTKGQRYKLKKDTREKQQELSPISGKQQWVETTCQRLGDWFDARRKNYAESPDFKNEIDHLKEWTTHVTPFSPFHTSRLTWLQAYQPYHKSQFLQAGKLVEQALTLMDESPESDDKIKIEMLIDMGYILLSSGDTDEALKRQNLALELQVKLTGESHGDTADLMGILAGTYDDLQQYEEAVKIYERALEINKQLFGEEHVATAGSFHLLGSSYYEAGKYRDAVDYLQKALELRTQLLGEEDEDTASTLYNYAVCIINLKKFKDAHERISSYLKKIPEDHPKFAELASLLPYIDRESTKSGFRAPSDDNTTRKGGGKKKKKKKKKK
ncbi:MAG: tetratricopeptide repeat protein [bacterium]|nr:tetratricopeptide repeat protein [bacterium]